MTRKSHHFTARYFTALVTVEKTYDRHAHTWWLTLHVQSASGLSYDVRELHTQQRTGKHIKPGVTYKAYGYYHRSDENWCSLDFLIDFAGLLRHRKLVMKYNRELRDSGHDRAIPG